MTLSAIIGFQTVFATVGNIDEFDRVLFDGHCPARQRQFRGQDQAAMLDTLCEQVGIQKATTQLITVNATTSGLSADFKATWSADSVIDALLEVDALPVGDAHTVIILACHNSDNDQFHSEPTGAFDRTFAGYHEIAGMAALVLADSTWAQQQGHYIYGRLVAQGIASQPEKAVNNAFSNSTLKPCAIGLVELTASTVNSVDVEFNGLCCAYAEAKDKAIALGSLRAITGEGYQFSHLLSLIKTVLSVYQGYFPGHRYWQGSNRDCTSPFFVSIESHPWYAAHNERVAACHLAEGNRHLHLLVADQPLIQYRPNGYFSRSQDRLLVLSQPTQPAMQSALNGLVQQLDEAGSLRALSQSLYQQFDTKQPLRLCLIAADKAELEREVTLAKTGVVVAQREGTDWKTPKGSYFTPNPQDDQVCFMYPGIGASYIGLGRSLFHLFPEMLPFMNALAENLAHSIRDLELNPRSLDRPSFKAIKSLDNQLRHRLADMAECGVTFACLYTAIFQHVFKVNPHFAMGYSMGEVSMYAALGVWKNPALMSQRLKQSDTFNRRLSGELLALDDYWQTDTQADRRWQTYSVRASKQRVEKAMVGVQRVYCTIINTADNLVLAGHPESCETVIQRLKTRAMPLDMANVIHSPPAIRDYDAMAELYHLEVQQKIPTALYSSACYLPVPQYPKAIANSLAKCLCDPVDFPRLIDAMYAKGARIFIEMGPGRSLSSWVYKILTEEQAHTSLPINSKGVSDELTLLRAMAKLVCHRVTVDLSVLFTGSLVVGGVEK